MASDFVRNIKNVKNIDILSRNITTENDLISTTDGDVYVVTKKGYKKITNVEVQDFENLKNEVSEINDQSNIHTSDIADLKTTTETNTSDIEDLKTTTETNTSDIEALNTTTGTNTSDIADLKTTSGNNTSDIADLKTTTDNNTSEIEALKNNKVLLFEGSASNTGDVMTLSQPYSDFTELKIKINRTGGHEILNFDAEDNGSMSLNITNIYDDNSEMKLYEMTIGKNSSTELEITGERSHTVINPTESDDSGITILKVWGVK